MWDDEETPTFLNYCRELAWELIDNPMLEGEKEAATQNDRRLWNIHKLITMPIVGTDEDGKRGNFFTIPRIQL